MVQLLYLERSDDEEEEESLCKPILQLCLAIALYFRCKEFSCLLQVIPHLLFSHTQWAHIRHYQRLVDAFKL